MARRILLSLLIPAATCGAWWLRGNQLSLSSLAPLSQDEWGLVLWALLGATALLTLLLSIPERGVRSLAVCRPVALGTVLQGAGALLVTAAGAWQLYQLYPDFYSLQTVSAAALLLGGLGLFGGLKACLGGKSKAGGSLLLSMCAAGTYLVLTYLEVSPDPNLLHFDMRMLAIGAAALALVALCSLHFGAGGRRWFLLFAALVPPLSTAALYTADSFPQALGLMGCTLAALGFFLSVLFGAAAKKKQTYELVEDPFHTGSVKRDEIRAAEAERAAKAEVPAAEPVSTAKPIVQKPAPAKASAPTPAAPTPQPAAEESFDLARVDRLLKELSVDKDNEN